MNRRTLLIQLLGLGAAGAGAALVPAVAAAPGQSSRSRLLPFQPVQGPIPLPSDGLTGTEQRRHYARINLHDKVVVPRG